MYCPSVTIADRRSDAARLFHALSDETRLAIVERLRGGELCVCDLTDLLEAAQSRLSFHLKVLRDAGLVRDRREGRWVYYALDPAAFDAAADAVAALRPKRGALPVLGQRCS
jgi:ArsR family transcriptional regulator